MAIYTVTIRGKKKQVNGFVFAIVAVVMAPFVATGLILAILGALMPVVAFGLFVTGLIINNSWIILAGAVLGILSICFWKVKSTR